MPGMPPAASAAVGRHLEDVIDELSRLASSGLTVAQFHAALLNQGCAALAATGGAIWVGSQQGSLRLDSQLNWQTLRLMNDPSSSLAHGQILHSTVQSEEPRVAALPSSANPFPSAVQLGGQTSLNIAVSTATEHLLVLAPWRIEDDAGVVELVVRSALSPQVQQGYLRFVAALAEIALDYHRQHRVRILRQREDVWQDFEQFVNQVHQGGDLQQVAFAVANEGRRMAQADRLSVIVNRGGKYQLLAVSGLDTVNRRANAVRQLETLAARVAVTGQSLWYYGHSDELPPQIQEPLQAYIEESHARTLAVVPLLSDEAQSADEQQQPTTGSAAAIPIGALIVEQFSAIVADDLFLRRVMSVAQHSTLAVRNAQAVDRLPLISFNRGLAKIGWLAQAKQLPKTLLVLGLLAAATLALILIPADFTVESPGELQPIVRQELFASMDGIVQQVQTEQGAMVDTGAPLLELRSPTLDFESARLSGELQTAEKKLLAIQAARLGLDGNDNESTTKPLQLTAEEETIKQQIASLKQQQEIVDLQMKELRVTSPIRGQVLTADLARLLANRPVQRGQKLLSLADIEGGWLVELHVPDNKVGYVQEAWQKAIDNGTPQSVEFALAIDPGTTYLGTVQNIAARTSPREQAEPTVTVTVRLDDPPPVRRPGARVIGNIDCGGRSLGFVWLHDAWNAIRRRVLF